MILCYQTVPKLTSSGYPLSSPRNSRTHRIANCTALMCFGRRKAKAIARIVRQLPAGELLGKHTKSGTIRISERVPISLRDAIAYHEFIEHEVMENDKR